VGNYLSAGVYVKEIDASAIVPNVSTSMAFFAGEFYKGPIEEPFVVTNKDELEMYFGKPDDKNYNQWFQCSKYLDYANQLTISRAYIIDQTVDTEIDVTLVVGATEIVGLTDEDIKYIHVGDTLKVDQNLEEIIVADIFPQQNNLFGIRFESPVQTDMSGNLLVITGYLNSNIDVFQIDDPNNAIPEGQTTDLYKNYDDFIFKKDTISFQTGVKLKFIARDAGFDGNDIEISISTSIDFMDYFDTNGTNYPSKAQAFEGISLLSLFDYAPKENEYAIVIRKDNTIESFMVSFDESAVDGNNKSMYIENVINSNSNLVYVVDNKSLMVPVQLTQPSLGGNIDYATLITPRLYVDSQGNLVGENNACIMDILETYGGIQLPTTEQDIRNAYFEVENKEYFDIDVVIGNEKDEGQSALELADAREDCIAFIGARYSDVVGKRAAEATKNIMDWVKSSTGPNRTMFGALFGNYHKIYDNYAKKDRFINVAGDMAGLRCQTNTDQASWWASAGLQRGQIVNIDRISFSPNQAQRDLLYSNNINPIVNFPGQGNLCWGQKTLLNYASSFDRINVRGLFNTIERAMAKAAKSSVFEFNDVYTRNSILAMFNPYLASVKAGRGISDFLVICDETNNTPDVISRNELHVDIYIKPMYAAEFIQLTFTNVGTRSFATVIGA